MIQYHNPIKWTVQIKVSKLFMGIGIGERQVFVPGQINLTNYKFRALKCHRKETSNFA